MQSKRKEIASGSQALRINCLWLLGTLASQLPWNAFCGDVIAGTISHHPCSSQALARTRLMLQVRWWKSNWGSQIRFLSLILALKYQALLVEYSADKIPGCFNPTAKKIHSQDVGIGLYFCRISKLLDVFYQCFLPTVQTTSSFLKIIFLYDFFLCVYCIVKIWQLIDLPFHIHLRHFTFSIQVLKEKI